MTSRIQSTARGPIEVVELGDDSPSSLPIVFLHHGFGSVASLEHLASALVRNRSGRRAICYSRAGCGRTPVRQNLRAIDYLHVEATAVLPALLDALGVRRAVLVGHSDGASIALLAAARLPGRIAAAVAIAPHVFIERRTLDGIRELAAHDDDPSFRARLARRHDDPATAYRSWRDAWLAPMFAYWSIVDELPRISTPLLLVQGTEDEFGTLAQLDVIERDVAGPVRKHVLDCVAHSPQNEHPEAVAASIERFLDELDANRRL